MARTYSFGVWTLVALVVGNAVGAGIYVTSGFALADLGSREWVMLAWFVGGLIALCGAMSYGMLVQGLSESGGEYIYLSRSIHPLAGFIAGWISLLAGFPGAIAFSATAFETYLLSALPNLKIVPNDLIACALVFIAGMIHIIRVKAGARTHELIVIIMLMVLAFIIVWAGVFLKSSNTLESQANTFIEPFNLLAFANSLVWISLSYSGFNAAAYVVEEVRNAKTAVPKGMIIGTCITLVLCVLINAIMIYGAPLELIVGKADIAVHSAQAMAGEQGRRFVEVVIALSLLTSITAMVLAGPRVYSKMAEEGALPKLFAAKQGEPPRMSIVLQVLTAMILILVADLRDLLSYLGFTLSLCLALAVSSLFVRHWRFSERPDSFWYPLAPIAFVVCTLLFATLSAINEPMKFYAALITIMIGVFAFLISKNKEHLMRRK